MPTLSALFRCTIIALLFALALSARAQTYLLDPTNPTATGGIGASLGYSFTVGASNLSITGLGYFDKDGDGLFASYPMGIWDNGGALIASATVLSGTSDPLVGNYRYVTLATPVILLSGQTYTVGGRSTGTDSFFEDGTATLNGAVFDVTALFDNTHPGLVEPTSVSAGNQFFQVNLQVGTVPEPATTASILSAAILGLTVLHRRRHLGVR